jgi:hypothetical protein
MGVFNTYLTAMWKEDEEVMETAHFKHKHASGTQKDANQNAALCFLR